MKNSTAERLRTFIEGGDINGMSFQFQHQPPRPRRHITKAVGWILFMIMSIISLLVLGWIAYTLVCIIVETLWQAAVFTISEGVT